MSEELIPEPLSLDEQIDNKLVKANVTEAVIADLRERYLPLKIAGIDDKETYLLVKEGRKNCKAIRVIATKICKDGREDAVAIQKKWVAKEKEVTSRIAEVEDYLEEQEKAYEAEVAAEKEARKRREEEQLILRQQILTSMGALYADGCFVLGEVSFELSAVKESDIDVWNDVINAAFLAEYQKLQSEELEKARLQQEREAEFKRQQEELERKQKDLADKEAKLKEEADRQAAAAQKAIEQKENARCEQMYGFGLQFDMSDNHFKGYGCFVPMVDIKCLSDENWEHVINGVNAQVSKKKAEYAEEKRKEQERQELQNKRHAELYPYKEYIGDNSIKMDGLWLLPEEQYMGLLDGCRSAQQKAEEEKAKKIAEEAAKAERERIEEEQRQVEAKKIKELREFRISALSQYNVVYNGERGELGALSEDQWWSYINDVKATFEEIKRKQEEERKAEELAQAGDKEKWNDIMIKLNAIDVHAMRSSQYRKKAAILREKLEEIKAL